MASILLLGCADSKENNATLDNKEHENEVIQITSRSVAQHYQVANTEKGEVNCLVDAAKKDSKSIILKSGSSVSLATGEKTTTTVEGVIWLRVQPEVMEDEVGEKESKTKACYVQTLFLDPVADYSPGEM